MRKDVLHGKTVRARSMCGQIYLTLNRDEGNLSEIAIRIGKSGNCIRSLLEVIGILLSILLQSGVDNEKIKKILIKHFEGVECGNPFFHEKERYASCLDYAGKIICRELKSEVPA